MLDEDLNDYKDLISNLPMNANKIPEVFFKNIFLPIFYGTETEVNGETIDSWIRVAGSTTKPVHVINNKQEIIFTVPPLISLASINIAAISGNSIGSRFFEISKIEKVNPKQANDIYQSLSKNISNAVKNPTAVSEVLKEWDSIFVRYGYEPKYSKILSNTNDTSNRDDKSELDGEFFEYD